MTHELISLNKGHAGWVLANLHGKLHMGAIGPCIEWNFLYQMHHHRSFEKHYFSLLKSLRSDAIRNLFTLLDPMFLKLI